ncbi:MAG TPA: CRISPR system precrRNA processing endoribonuclease RAMP protein Cas6 [Verrucomicrobiae bacterium]|nr:CRISPR system precrRNA processing endoribonuclease RAMP protein Cas6 [Verrucomicrobiae bacterium]
MEFNFVRLELTVSLQPPHHDPYRFFEMGRFFPSVFRERGSGAWEEIFAQAVSADPEEVRRHQKPPLPFVFDLPVLSPSEREARVGLVLVGRGISRLPEFLQAFSNMLAAGEPVRGSLLGVACRGFSGEETAVSSTGEGAVILNGADYLQEPEGVGGLGLTFDTPLKLTADGRTLHRFDFSVFFRSLLRRLSSLAACYCGTPLQADFQRLASLSREISVDDSRMQAARWKGERISGVLGTAGISGDLLELQPFLRLGTFFHCGKGASYGLGRFRLEG